MDEVEKGRNVSVSVIVMIVGVTMRLVSCGHQVSGITVVWYGSGLRYCQSNQASIIIVGMYCTHYLIAHSRPIPSRPFT
jgi:hypothetical protein